MNTDLTNDKKRIQSLYLKNQFDKSYNLVLKLINHYSNDSSLYYSKGLLEVKKDNFLEAINSFEKSIDLARPNISKDTLLQICECHLVLGSYNDAIIIYKNISKELSNDFDCHNGLGRAYYLKEEYDKAITYFLKALNINDTDYKLFFNLGAAYFYNENFICANKYFRKYLSIIDLNTCQSDHLFKIYDYISRSYLQLRQYKELLEFLDDILVKLPKNTSILHYIGLAYIGLGNFDSAEEYFSKVYSINKDFDQNNFNYCNAVLMKGDKDTAKTIIDLAIIRNPKYLKYLEFASKIKCLENDIYFNWMKEIFYNSDTDSNSKQLAGFGIFSALDRAGSYDEAFKYLIEANRLKRSSLTFSSKKIFTQHSLIKLLEFPIIKNENNKLKDLPNPIFIVGMPRSGTTLVEQILDSHSQIYGAGELSIIPEIADSFEVLSLHNNIIDPKKIEDMRLKYFKSIKSLEYFEKPFIVDKMPGNYFWIGLISELIPNAKFIHCMRNPMDTCLSIYSKNFINNLNGCYDLDEIGDLYICYYNLMRFWNNKISSKKIFNLSYESLIYDNENKIKEILKFSEVDFEEKCLRFYENNRFVKTASSTEVREKIYSKSINRWKNYENQLLGLEVKLQNNNILY